MKRLLITFASCLWTGVLFAQALLTPDAAKQFLQATENRRSANSKDLLSNIMQLSLQNLLGEDKSFQLNTTLYALDSILNPSSRSITDDEYRRQRTQRHIQLNAALAANDNNEIAKISGGFTWAISNRKDVTYQDYRSEIVPELTRFEGIRKEVNLKIEEELTAQALKAANDSFILLIADQPKLKNKDLVKASIRRYYDSLASEEMSATQASWEKADDAGDYSQLAAAIRKQLENVPLSDREFILSNGVHKKFLQLAELYARKGLLTFSGNYRYDRIEEQPEYDFALNYTVGINQTDLRRKPWELETWGRLKISRDTLLPNGNTDLQLFSAGIGINKILIEDGDGKSAMELKGFLGYDARVDTNRPSNTDTDLFTFNTTLRFRVLQSLWIPLTLSYDPEHANFLGKFSLTANLGDLTGN